VQVDPATLRAVTDAAAFSSNQIGLQHAQLTRLAEAIALPRLMLPGAFVASAGPKELAELADALAVGVEALP
jgi:hypothetical protein